LAKDKTPPTLIDKLERFCTKQQLFSVRDGQELWVLSAVRKPAGKQKVVHRFVEQPTGRAPG
jgi:hypothetical protein